jgi:Dolichyl-phosphate-mannose-protein mannosyltransferase
MLKNQLGESTGFRWAQWQIEGYGSHPIKIVAAVLIFWFHVTGLRVALLLYCLLAIVQIRQKPGLQYDEALLVMGSVHLDNAADHDFPLPHDPHTWVEVAGQWFPLMTVRYVGAIKEYLWWPLVANLGPSTSSIRLLSALFGLIGIGGFGVWLRANAGARAAGVAALALAINPSYVAMTVFDNGTVSVFMASLGLLCAAIALYQRRGARWAAFLVGLAAGFGIWARVNFIWLLAAMLLAMLIILRRSVRKIPLSHWAAAAGGLALGCAPLIVYQVVSHGGTFEAVGMFSSHDTIWQRLATRSRMLAECLISDREHRVMWDAPPPPLWQVGLLAPVWIAACIACLRGSAFQRILATAFLIFGACLFFSGLPVAEHHLVTLLPFAAAMTVLAAFSAPRWAAIALAVVYAGCAFQWQTAAVAGLRRTGGAGPWSDGVVTLATRLKHDYAPLTETVGLPQKAEIKFLDWGFQQNIYVLTDGHLRTREIFGDATPQQSGMNRTWTEEIRDGGVFVLFAPGLRQMPVATTAFLAALRDAAPVTRRFSVARRDGAPYAEVIDVEPDTLHQAAGTRLATADPRIADRLEGFYQIETGWRWSRPAFAITLDAPLLAGARAVRLSVDVYLPDSLIRPLGAVTLSGRANGHALQPETWRQSGRFTLTRDLPPGWLQQGPNRFEFTVDKSTHANDRELGIVVAAAALDAVE